MFRTMPRTIAAEVIAAVVISISWPSAVLASAIPPSPDWTGVPVFTSDSHVSQVAGRTISIGGTGVGTKASHWWIRCPSEHEGEDAFPPSQPPPGEIGLDAALNATEFDRIGLWMNNDGSAPRAAMYLQIVSNDCSTPGYDYYQTMPIEMDWVGWRWIALSLEPGEPQGASSSEAVFPLHAMRDPLPMASSIQRLVVVEAGGSGTNTVQLGGAALYKSFIESARETFTGFVGEGAEAYVRRHEVVFRDSHPNMTALNASDLPPGVTMNVEWKVSAENPTLVIELRALSQDLVIDRGDDDVISTVRIELDPRDEQETIPRPFPCELELSWAPGFETSAALESWKDASLNADPLVWATKDQFERALVNANNNDATSWRNLTVEALLEYAAEWPTQFVTRWESVSSNGTWQLPPHGGQNIITYPTLCTDGSSAVLDASTSTFNCETGYEPHECGSSYEPATHLGHGAWSCEDGSTPTPKWNRWPYDVLTYDMRHVELADAAFKLAMAYQLGAGDAAADAVWDILLAYSQVYETTYERHMRDDPPDSVNTMSMVGKADSGRVHSQAMEEAWWLYNMARAYDLVRGRPPSSLASAGEAVETGLLRPGASVLLSFVSPGNHQSYHNLGLAALGLALEDFVLVRQAYERYHWGMRYQLDSSGGWCYEGVPCVMPGGMWYEGSFVYHMVALAPLVETATCLRRVGMDLFREGSLSDMITLPTRAMMPDTLLPRINDAHNRWLEGYGWLYEAAYSGTCGAGNCDRDVGYLLAQGRDRFRTNRNYNGILFGNYEIEQIAPSEESSLLDNAGFAVLRQRSKDAPASDTLYAIVDFGPHAGWHGHLDKLGLITYGLGTVRGTDPGTASYKLANHDGWFRTTLAHNTVVMDSTNQEESTGQVEAWHTATKVASMVTVSATAAYQGVSVYERSLVLAPEYLLDVFHVAAMDGLNRTWDWAYHDGSGTNVNKDGEARVDGTLPFVSPAGDNEVASEEQFVVLSQDAGYDYLSSVTSFVGASSWEVVFNNVPDSSYGDFVGENAGFCSYATSPLDKNVQAASWVAAEETSGGGLLSTIRLRYDVTPAQNIATMYSMRMIFTLDPPAQDIPAGASPTRLTLSYRGNTAAQGMLLKFRVYDSSWQRKEVQIGVIDSTEWKNATVDVSREGFVAPLNILTPYLFWGLGDLVGDVFLGDITLDFDDGTRLPWAPVSSQSSSSTTGTRLLTADANVPTQAIVGLGIEEDLSVKLPAVLLRRNAPSTTFSVVHEHWRGAPGSNIQSYEEINQNCTAPVQHVTGKEWQDWVLVELPVNFTLPSECGSELSPGRFADGMDVVAKYAYLRVDNAGLPIRLATKSATAVGNILQSSGQAVDFDVTWLATGIVRVNTHMSVTSQTEIAILATGVTALYVDDVETDFDTEGNNIVFELNAIA